MYTEGIIENGATVEESCYNDDTNDQNAAAPTNDNNISPTERHKTWQKRKRQGTTQRAKERRIAEWSVLSEEQQEERKRNRKEQLELMDQKLLNALENGLNVCVDLSFDGANVSDKVIDILIIYNYRTTSHHPAASKHPNHSSSFHDMDTLHDPLFSYIRSVQVSANNCHCPGVY